jgi:hypothetical protein
VWRRGIAPQMSRAGLEALRRALAADDPRLVQGATLAPPPLHQFADQPVEAACALAYPGWQAEGCATVGEAEHAFARLCDRIDQALGVPGATRLFLAWYDETPRAEMRRLLLAEVEHSLAEGPEAAA